MEPITRKERILSGEDIEPITRLEYFLKEAAGGGGGGLPSYTSADIGKALTVTAHESTTLTVCPTQAPTQTGGLNNVSFDGLHNGDTVVVNVRESIESGYEYFGEFVDGATPYVEFVDNNSHTGKIYADHLDYFRSVYSIGATANITPVSVGWNEIDTLPPYTSADKGKVLGLGEASPVETEVFVIPEQSVVLTDDAQYALVSNADFSNVSGGDTLTLKIDGHEETVTAIANYGGYDFVITTTYSVSGGTATVQIGYDDELGCGFDYQFRRQGSDVSERVAGTYAISLSAVQSVTPSITTVIVPEQTVTTNDSGAAMLENADAFASLSVGDDCVLTVNGSSYIAEVSSHQGHIGIWVMGIDTFAVVDTGDGISFTAHNDGYPVQSTEFTVSVYTTSVPIAPAWVSGVGEVVSFSNAAANSLLTRIQALMPTAISSGAAFEASYLNVSNATQDDFDAVVKIYDNGARGNLVLMDLLGNICTTLCLSTSGEGNKIINGVIPIYTYSNYVFRITSSLNANTEYGLTARLGVELVATVK